MNDLKLQKAQNEKLARNSWKRRKRWQARLGRDERDAFHPGAKAAGRLVVSSKEIAAAYKEQNDVEIDKEDSAS